MQPNLSDFIAQLFHWPGIHVLEPGNLALWQGRVRVRSGSPLTEWGKCHSARACRSHVSDLLCYIVGSRVHRHAALDDRERQALGLQVAFVGADQSGEMCPG